MGEVGAVDMDGVREGGNEVPFACTSGIRARPRFRLASASECSESCPSWETGRDNGGSVIEDDED